MRRRRSRLAPRPRKWPRRWAPPSRSTLAPPMCTRCARWRPSASSSADPHPYSRNHNRPARTAAEETSMNTVVRRRRGGLLLSLLMMGLAPLGAHAAWPEDKPIRMIVPYTAGGASDTLGRMIAARLTESLKQTVVVENKPGAGSMLGSQYVARAEPDEIGRASCRERVCQYV